MCLYNLTLRSGLYFIFRVVSVLTLWPGLYLAVYLPVWRADCVTDNHDWWAQSWWPDLGAKWVRLAPNGTNPGIVSDEIQYILPNILNLIWGNLLWVQILSLWFRGRQPIGCVTFRLLCYSDLPLISTVWFVAGENVPFANRKQDFATVVIRLLSTVSVSRWRWLDKGFCLVVFIVNVYLLSSITALFCIFSFRCIFQRIIMFSGVNLLTRKKKSRLQNIYLTLSFPLVNSDQLIYQIGRI